MQMFKIFWNEVEMLIQKKILPIVFADMYK